MQANKKQIGGEHYKSEYQHWDWVAETNQGYLMGCATKYINSISTKERDTGFREVYALSSKDYWSM